MNITIFGALSRQNQRGFRDAIDPLEFEDKVSEDSGMLWQFLAMMHHTQNRKDSTGYTRDFKRYNTRVLMIFCIIKLFLSSLKAVLREILHRGL